MSSFLVGFSGLFIVILAAALSPVGAQQSDFVPVTDTVLRNPDPGDWLRWRRDHSASGYSPLEQVHRQNVGKLSLAWGVADGGWATGAGTDRPQRSNVPSPTPITWCRPLNARTGELIWEYRRDFPEDVGSRDTRNIAIYQDKIFLGTPDAYLVALSAQTGAVVWETKVADYQKRDRYTAGPIAADGKVFAGLSCNVGTLIPCFMTAHNAATGKTAVAKGVDRRTRRP